MKEYATKQIRNVVLAGHPGSGKTTLTESMLFTQGVINRQGSVESKSTVSDGHKLEQEREHSLFNTPLFFEIDDVKVNLIDTPGYSDYQGELIGPTRAVENVAVVLNAQTGVDMGSESAFDLAKKNKKTTIFIINKLDLEQAKFDQAVEELKEMYGNSCTLVQFPLKTGPGANAIIDVIDMKLYEYSGDGKAQEKDIPDSEKEKAESLRNELIESIAETDEELMDKYFEQGELSEDDFKGGFKKAVAERQIYPILCACGKSNVGTDKILEFAAKYMPSPDMTPAWKTTDDQLISLSVNQPISLFVYKMFSEAHLGDMTYFKVVSGNLKTATDLINEQKNATERFNQLFAVNGRKREEVDSLAAGDLGATVKLKSTQISHTLHEKGKNIVYPELEYPQPIVRTAIAPVTKGEEEKVGMGLNSICQEDPSYKFEHSQELRQMILYGQGEMHLSSAKWRLEDRFKVESEFIKPKVPYRETIQKQVKTSYRHKKQTGGAGQFAEVYMMVEPYVEDAPVPKEYSVRGRDIYDLDWGGKLEFINSIVGGAIDQRFLPAIMKGVMEKMEIGPLTGSYARDIRLIIHDGKMHSVDSNEAAFKTAGMMAFKEAFIKANPKLLEPVYNVKIKAPKEYVGDIMSDLPSRRAIIQGIDSEGRYQQVNAVMPLAELDRYSSALRSMTQAKATFSAEFAEYQAVPANVQEELIKEYNKEEEEE